MAGQGAGQRQVRRGGALVAALALGIAALGLAGSHVARSQAVLGPVVSRALQAEAARRGVDLHVGRLRPVGLTGVRLEDVRLRAARQEATATARFEAVELRPTFTSLVASLSSGRPLPGAVEVIGGQIVLGPGTSHTAPSSPATTTPSKAGRPGLDEPLALTIRVRDVALSVEGLAGVRVRRPVRLRRAEAQLALGSGGTPRVIRVGADGRLPDGASFVLTSGLVPGARGQDVPEYRLSMPGGVTRLDRWLVGDGRRAPLEAQVESVAFCPGCQRQMLQVLGLTVDLPNLRRGLRVRLPESELDVRGDDGTIRWALGGARIEALKDGDELGVRLRRAELTLDMRARRAGGSAEVDDEQGGGLQFNWSWDQARGVVEGEVLAQRFATSAMLAMLDVDDRFRRGQIHGRVAARADLGVGLVSVRTRVGLEDASLELPPLAQGPLEVGLAWAEAEALIDLRGRALSVTEGQLELGDAAGIRFGFHGVDTGPGVSFGLHVDAPEMEPDALLEALPAAMAESLQGARLRGMAGASFRMAGHTEYPEGMIFEPSFGGHIEVLADGPGADVRALKGSGPPLLAEDTTIRLPRTADWTALDQLPSHVPQALLAAEDARFWRHDGFAWRGIRRAMIHNLRVRSVERGGSTITQQLIKNLFLHRRRTLARKLQEAYLTWRVEQELDKERILELYLNVVDFGGPRVRGIRQAAAHYFSSPPEQLSTPQMALLASILPNPTRFGGHIDRGHLASSRLEKFRHVLANLRGPGHISEEDYWRWRRAAERGQIGGLELTICGDDEHAPQGAPPCPGATSTGRPPGELAMRLPPAQRPQ